jgi:hypothetical protein
VAARPQNIENLRSVADQAIWAFATYGYPAGMMAGARPQNLENIRSLAEQIVWIAS